MKDAIKVEILLEDLISIREDAGFYKMVAQERTELEIKVKELKAEIEQLKKELQEK